MLFNSVEFLFAFLPITLVVFYLLGPQTLKAGWLVAASLFFYAWWDWHNLFLLGFSLVFNYTLSQHLIARTAAGRPGRRAMQAGIAINLGLLIWFKYANFLAGNVGSLLGEHWSFGRIALPLAISFFTFQQISYLVDGYRGQVARCSPLDYGLVVTFFPHLIAGPIVRYQAVLPQFRRHTIFQFDSTRIGAGLSLFCLGLFKKMVFADSISPYANSAFDAAAQGVVLTSSEAWVGALSYTLQLYFDFSGYSDMAIGLAWMFGIQFSLNFNSPYKSDSIIEFWRRWHITLSSFLRDYLYISFGGNRRGNQHVNLVTTMLLGGLWHGAGWPFVIWGGMHGLYLVSNHGWRSLMLKLGSGGRPLFTLPRPLAWMLTFLAVVLAWVLFRAVDLKTAGSILSSMAGLNGVELPEFLRVPLGFLAAYGVGFSGFTANVGIPQAYSIVGIIVLLFVAVACPNTQQWMGSYNPALEQAPSPGGTGILARCRDRLLWRPSFAWSAAAGGMLAVCVLCLTRVAQFIYFQF